MELLIIEKQNDINISRCELFAPSRNQKQIFTVRTHSRTQFNVFQYIIKRKRGCDEKNIHRNIFKKPGTQVRP